MNIETMAKDDKSLLLYLETRATDYGGRVDTRHMNDIDFVTAERWNAEHFVAWGRIVAADISLTGSHWCYLSDEAWRIAQTLRRQHADRMWKQRAWETTAEANDSNKWSFIPESSSGRIENFDSADASSTPASGTKET